MPPIVANGSAVLLPVPFARSARPGLVRRCAAFAGQGLVLAALMVAGAVAAQALMLVAVLGAPILAGVLLWNARSA